MNLADEWTVWIISFESSPIIYVIRCNDIKWTFSEIHQTLTMLTSIPTQSIEDEQHSIHRSAQKENKYLFAYFAFILKHTSLPEFSV